MAKQKDPREDKQNEIVKDVIELGVKCWLKLFTGFGKTNVAIKLINYFNRNGTRLQGHDRIIHIVVPSEVLLKQWESRLKKSKITNTRVFIVNTYVKDRRTCDFLIIDEGHLIASQSAESFNKVFENSYKFILVLSATFTQQHEIFMFNKGLNCAGEITIEEGREKGWTSNFRKYILKLELDEETRNELDSLNKRLKSAFSYFGNSRNVFNTAILCLGDKVFRKKYASDNGKDENVLFLKARDVITIVGERKKLLHRSNIKKECIVNICKKIQCKTIVFGQSNEFANDVAIALNNANIRADSYHSDKSDSIKEETIRKFTKSLKQYVLTSSSSLNTGVDFPDLKLGIVAGFDSSKVKTQQQLGRVTRLFKDKSSIIIYLCINNSQDETWLSNSGADEDAYIVYSIDEILQMERI